MLKIFSAKPHALLLLTVFILGCITAAYQTTDFAALYGPSEPRQRILTSSEYQQSLELDNISYREDVKPILDSRCVVCHACYDAPCQLKLSSFAGLDRGAKKQPVYDTQRLETAMPTRLFIDAVDTAGWREKAFFPVLNEREHSPEAALNNSLLAFFLHLKRHNPQPESSKLPDDFAFEMDRPLTCPSIDEFAQFQKEHPLWGMPYAMPGLSRTEEATIWQWLQEGAKVSEPPPLSVQAIAEIEKWETFFNGESLRQRLVSRYIYEHLFIGHLHFQGRPEHEFYYLVRSRTAPGQPIQEINTVRPYDDPGNGKFYYRLRPVVATITDKNHFVYELSDARLQRYRELFFDVNYDVSELPTYMTESAANPFKTFQQIPEKSRYQFLLDDAEFFFSGFIKGPVCHGQVAINVIQDQFWIAFIKPDSPFASTVSRFLKEHPEYLIMPNSAGDDIGVFGWRTYDALGETYLEIKDQFIDQNIVRYGKLGLDMIWDGGGSNTNAALTVFRHFDSATVVAGFVGDTPLTGWVVDYPIFERIHYLLVAGFNVFGSMSHQFATRTYMDYIRMEAENNFLRFMPAAQRQAMHDDWYRGIGAQVQKLFSDPRFSIDHESAIVYRTDQYKQEFFRQIIARLGPAAGIADTLNRCWKNHCPDSEKTGTPLQAQADAYMKTLAHLQGEQIQALPDVSFLRIRTDDPDRDPVYTLVVNKALSNLSFVFAEDIRRTPENDTLTVIPGFLGSYPNFFFSLTLQQMPEFIASLKNARSTTDLDAFYSRFGIRRSNPEIWAYSDWFNAQYKKRQGLKAGLFDLNRYRNL